jgi:uncharacterized protein (DUF1778 family)
MAKVGRPQIDAIDRKASYLTLRISATERALIDDAASKSAAKKATTWAREILLAKAREVL